jgi:hypothetical protein
MGLAFRIIPPFAALVGDARRQTSVPRVANERG